VKEGARGETETPSGQSEEKTGGSMRLLSPSAVFLVFLGCGRRGGRRRQRARAPSRLLFFGGHLAPAQSSCDGRCVACEWVASGMRNGWAAAFASGQGGRRPASESGLAKGVPTALPIVCGVWSPHRLARWCGHAGDTPLSSGRRCHHRRAAQGFLEIVLPHGTECRPTGGRAGMRGGLSFKRSGPAMTAMCAVVSELAERVEAAGW